MTAPVRREIDITNQKFTPSGSSLRGTWAIAKVIAGTMPDINAFIERNSGMNVMESARLNEPPASSRMNSD